MGRRQVALFPVIALSLHRLLIDLAIGRDQRFERLQCAAVIGFLVIGGSILGRPFQFRAQRV